MVTDQEVYNVELEGLFKALLEDFLSCKRGTIKKADPDFVEYYNVFYKYSPPIFSHPKSLELWIRDYFNFSPMTDDEDTRPIKEKCLENLRNTYS